MPRKTQPPLDTTKPLTPAARRFRTFLLGLWYLSQEEYRIAQLAERLELKQRATERLVASIEEAGIELVRRQDGREVYVSVAPSARERAERLGSYGISAPR